MSNDIDRKTKTRIALTLPISIKQKLDKLAKEDNRTTSNLINTILISWLKDK